MTAGKKRVHYGAEHYLALKTFQPPKTSYGLRRIPLKHKIASLTSFLTIAAFLAWYLYTQALTFEVESGLLPAGSKISTLFFTSLGGATLALPLVVLIIWYLRRTFVQPVFIYVELFLYGAGFSILAALIVSGFTADSYTDIIEVTQSNPLSFFATVHAPIFEELFKGLGLLFILMSLPFFVRTVHDGAVYGMLIGFGFAFTENIQYFVQHGNTKEGFIFLLFMRIFASLLTHATFTAATGLIMAYFWCKYGSYPKAIIGWFLGFLVAASLHALWNGTASIGLFLIIYILVFLPVFTASTVILRRTAELYDSSYVPILDRYRDKGWFPESLYANLFPKMARKRHFRFVDSGTKKEERFLASALSELVFVRQSLDKGSQSQRLIRREKEILIGLFSYQKSKKGEQA